MPRPATPPRTPAVVKAEKQAKKQTAQAEADAARFAVVLEHEGRELRWDYDETTGRTSFDFHRQTSMGVSEFVDTLGRQALGGAVDPWIFACLVWLAQRQAGENPNLDRLLDSIDVDDVRGGGLAPAPPAPKA